MKKTGIKIVASLLIFLNVLFVMPERASAIPVIDAANIAAQVAGNALTFSLVNKEFVLDTLLSALLNAVRIAVVKSVVEWINSGFDGSPAFVQNLKGYAKKVGDDVQKEFIDGAKLDALSPQFAGSVKDALKLEYASVIRSKGENIIKPTFTDIEKDIKKFGEKGDTFTTEDLFAYVSNPVNSPLGAYLDAKDKLKLAVDNTESREMKLLDYGKGFLSKKLCTTISGNESCNIVTPGDNIAASLNKALGVGVDALIAADELNEFFGAALGYFLSTALNSIVDAAQKIEEEPEDGGLFASSTGVGQTGSITGVGQTGSSKALDLSKVVEIAGPIVSKGEGVSRRLDSVLKLLNDQCSIDYTLGQNVEFITQNGQNTKAVTTMPGGLDSLGSRLENYKKNGVFDIYTDITARKGRVDSLVLELKNIPNKSPAKNIKELTLITNRVATLSQSPDLYQNPSELDDIIDSANNTIERRCKYPDEN